METKEEHQSMTLTPEDMHQMMARAHFWSVIQEYVIPLALSIINLIIVFGFWTLLKKYVWGDLNLSYLVWFYILIEVLQIHYRK